LAQDKDGAHHQSLAHPGVANRYLTGRLLLRRVLVGYLGAGPGELVFERTARGKPVLVTPEGQGLAFNLSHTATQSILAVAGARHLGVDLEPLDRASTTLEIGRQYFSQAEIRRLGSLGNDAARYALTLWTLKESIVKALGEPVWEGLEGVELEIGDGAIRLLVPPSLRGDDDSPWVLATGVFRQNYMLSLALKPEKKAATGPLELRCFILDEDDSGDQVFRPSAAKWSGS
jgi:4'-phosphopantetheinyl transferase